LLKIAIHNSRHGPTASFWSARTGKPRRLDLATYLQGGRPRKKATCAPARGKRQRGTARGTARRPRNQGTPSPKTHGIRTCFFWADAGVVLGVALGVVLATLYLPPKAELIAAGRSQLA
jgi:hypothetical protein